MEMKLFLLRSNLSNEGKYPISWGNTPSGMWQPRRLNTFKECKPKKEGSCNPTVGDEWNKKSRFLTSIPLPYILLMTILEGLSKEK